VEWRRATFWLKRWLEKRRGDSPLFPSVFALALRRKGRTGSSERSDAIRTVKINKLNSAVKESVRDTASRVPSPPPLPLRVAKAGRNNLNEEIPPLLPTGIGGPIQPNHIKFRTCSALTLM
jgi:hypothetical protein